MLFLINRGGDAVAAVDSGALLAEVLLEGA
jgi:hypothetical protein